MLEILKEALEECKIEKAIAEEVNFEEEIQRDLAEAEAKIRAEYDARKAEGVRDCDYQIRAIEKLITKETAKLNAKAMCENTTAAAEASVANEFCGAV